MLPSPGSSTGDPTAATLPLRGSQIPAAVAKAPAAFSLLRERQTGKNDFLLYLDPHYCSPGNYPDTHTPLFQSFQCRSLRKMPFGKMDPSCTIGFYAGAGTGLDALCKDLSRVTPERYPLFTLVEGGGRGDGAPPSSGDVSPPRDPLRGRGVRVPLSTHHTPPTGLNHCGLWGGWD
uniref:Cysteine protease n=1 Tax=Melopsittacus undulatus TaxID=13146 RepID=A0A8V5GI48_MELUD